jgi:hypothetical protein
MRDVAHDCFHDELKVDLTLAIGFGNRPENLHDPGENA